MPNFVTVLKQEIARIARHESKAAVAPVRNSTVGLIHATADLKRRVAAIEKAIRDLKGAVQQIQAATPTPPVDQIATARITAKGLLSLRKKLGLSQGQMALLVGVTGTAVGHWEKKKKGTVRLRQGTREAIIGLRGVGARAAKKMVEEIAAKKNAVKRVVKKGKQGRKARKQIKSVAKRKT